MQQGEYWLKEYLHYKQPQTDLNIGNCIEVEYIRTAH